MTDYTYRQAMDAAQRAHEAGRPDHARQLVQMALRAQKEQQKTEQQPQAEQPQPEPQPEADMSFWGRVKDNVVGVDDGVESTGEYTAGLLNQAGQGLMFGFGDEADAAARSAFNDKSYEGNLSDYRQKEAEFQEAHPVASTAAQIGGAVLPTAFGVGAVGNTIRGGMAVGAGQGMAHGFGSGEGGVENRAQSSALGMLLGGALGGAVPAVARGVRSTVNTAKTRSAIRQAARGAPTSEQLRAQGQALYREVNDAGVQIRPEAFDRARHNTLDRLSSQTGFDSRAVTNSLTPNSTRVMQIMEEASDEMSANPASALAFRDMDRMRRQAGGAAGNVTSKEDKKASMAIIDELDGFISNLTPNDVVAGNPAALNSALPRARETWARMSRSQALDDAISQEENYVSGGASAIKNQFSSILKNPNRSRGFSEAEKGAMRRVVGGGPVEHTVRLMGSGIGNITQMGLGAGFGGLGGAVLGAATSAATRGLSNSITRKNAELARAAVASGKLANLAPLPKDSALQQLFVRSIRNGSNSWVNQQR